MAHGGEGKRAFHEEGTPPTKMKPVRIRHQSTNRVSWGDLPHSKQSSRGSQPSVRSGSKPGIHNKGKPFQSTYTSCHAMGNTPLSVKPGQVSPGYVDPPQYGSVFEDPFKFDTPEYGDEGGGVEPTSSWKTASGPDPNARQGPTGYEPSYGRSNPRRQSN